MRIHSAIVTLFVCVLLGSGLSVSWFPPRVLPDRSSLGYYPTALRGLACPI